MNGQRRRRPCGAASVRGVGATAPGAAALALNLGDKLAGDRATPVAQAMEAYMTAGNGL